jgi:1-acyl-sn-glycerol-3-phosphate acyltransferase
MSTSSSTKTYSPPRKASRYSSTNISNVAWFVRFCLRMISIFFVKVMARTRVEGLENIPDGPAIFAANHSSIYDAILYFAYLPTHTQFVGPGDFRLKYPNRIASEWTDVILVDRGSRDTSSLRAMVDTLKSGSPIGLFPEGGTWEKGLYNVKDGAAYLSISCQVPMVPIAISGAYDLWRKIWTFQRPEIVMKILPPMPMPEKVRGAQRKRMMETLSINLMYHIYDALEPSELDRYKRYMRQEFHGCFDAKDREVQALFPSHQDYALIADMVSKKNLFSTFHEHLKIPVHPFLRPDRYHSALAWQAAVDSLYDALTNVLDGYMNYRRGEKARQQILTELEELSAILAQADKRAMLRFKITVTEQDRPIDIDKPDALPQDVV